jgi:hypothetical protein
MSLGAWAVEGLAALARLARIVTIGFHGASFHQGNTI